MKQESTTRHTQKIRPWWLSNTKRNTDSVQTRHVKLDQRKVQPLVWVLWSKVLSLQQDLSMLPMCRINPRPLGLQKRT